MCAATLTSHPNLKIRIDLYACARPTTLGLREWILAGLQGCIYWSNAGTPAPYDKDGITHSAGTSSGGRNLDWRQWATSRII